MGVARGTVESVCVYAFAVSTPILFLFTLNGSAVGKGIDRGLLELYMCLLLRDGGIYEIQWFKQTHFSTPSSPSSLFFS